MSSSIIPVFHYTTFMFLRYFVTNILALFHHLLEITLFNNSALFHAFIGLRCVMIRAVDVLDLFGIHSWQVELSKDQIMYSDFLLDNAIEICENKAIRKINHQVQKDMLHHRQPGCEFQGKCSEMVLRKWADLRRSAGWMNFSTDCRCRSTAREPGGTDMPGNTDTEAIRQAYIRMYDGMISKDEKILNEVLDASFVLVHMTGMRQPKQAFIKAVLNGMLNYFSAEHENMPVEIIGDTAVLTGQSYVAAAVFGGGRSNWHLQ
ncbi:MAG: nuclear transport factor 2 family protein [Sarcina sp.]|nr:nuclear transport factor 2 family protein [Sarcina sp.]